MHVLDVIIVLLFVTALYRGQQRGLARQISSTVGLLVGFFLGAFIQGRLIHLAHTPSHKAMLSLLIILSAVVIFATIGEYIGAFLKGKIDDLHLKSIATTDKILGSITAGVTLLLLVWLSAAIFASAPIPGLQRHIKNSVLVASLNDSLPSAPNIVASIGHLIDPNGFPDVFTGLEPRIDNTVELPSIGELDAAVMLARTSIVKVEGLGCGGISDGSGFIADNGLIITNAHVIAGVKKPYVIDANGKHDTRVLWFDPELDMAVLRTNNLAGQTLTIREDTVPNGTMAAALGYPGGGDFSAKPAVILDSFRAVGRNIYNQDTSERAVYSVKSAIQPGNSGGPLIDADGAVIGLIFAKSTSYDTIGYALNMDAVMAGFNQAKDRNQTVGTGSCTS